MLSHLTVGVFSFIVVLALVPLAIRVARRLDFLDYPRGHKSHQKPTPLLGGAVIFISLTGGLVFSLSMGWITFSATLIGFYVSGLVLVLLGLWDDKMGLSPFRKFAGQLAAVLLFLLFYDPTLTGLGFPLGFILLIIWLVGLINALNFLDNMDGLCSGISLVASLAFAVLAYLNGQTLLLVISLSLAGAYLAFLKFNLSPARIFLGDTGSLLSGFALAAMGLIFVSEARTQYSLLAPILILSYPIFDICFVTFTRLKQGRKFYQGGLDHSSHRLVYLGVTSQKAVLGILLISLFLAGTGVLTFYFFDSPVKIIVPLALAFALTLFGIHLHRNFIHYKEKLLLIGFDLVLVNLIFWGVYQIYPLNQEALKLAGFPFDPSTLAILLTFFWINLFAIAGLYEFYWGMLVKEEWKAITKTVLGGGLVLFLLGSRQILNRPEVTAAFTLYMTMLLLGGLSYRALFIFIYRKLSRTGNLSYPAVIVGTEKNARLTWEELNSQKKRAFKVIGFIDENHSPAERQLPVQILGKLENLEGTLRQNRVREILIAVEPTWPGSLNEVLETAHNLEVNFRIKQNLLERVRGCKVVPLLDNSFYKVYPSQMRTWEWGVKRLVDLTASAVILTVNLPILAWVYLWKSLVERESPLETVTLLGRGGKRIKVSQFRPGFLNGFWQRLPLLASVLKGDLSLIGPSWVRMEKEEDPQLLYSVFEDKLKVRPGLIFPDASVSLNSNGNVRYAKSNSGDLEYIERMSFASDLGVLLKRAARPLVKLIF
jgi:UDP-GlcNAc:undecaprenyl-phosphate GlcNAc-1-phosphate transferase